MSTKNGKRRANLRDVARAAEVSVATVSRVLNTPDLVQAKTRARVQAEIARLGFVRSAAARAINTGRTKILGALIPTLNSDIFAQTIDAIENRLTDLGFSLVVATTEDDPDVEAHKAQELLDIGVEGLFVTGVTHSDTLHNLIERTRVPAVAISFFDPSYRQPTIGYDNHAAGRIACQHLYDLGHRRIAVIHGPVDNNDRTRARLVGVNTVGADLSLSIFEAELSVRGGSAIIEQLSGHVTEFDAILCLSDVIAYGAIFECQRRSIAVPDDVSVVGIQDMPISAAISPGLSTVRLPAQEMGLRAAEALAAWVEHETRPSALCLPAKLVTRASAKAKR